MTAKMPAKVAIIAAINITEPDKFASNSVKNISLEIKPLVSGTPAIEAAVIKVKVAVKGSNCQMPLSLRKSRVPVSWSMMPANMNNAALKVAWLIIWKMAAATASGEPMPSKQTISPK